MQIFGEYMGCGFLNPDEPLKNFAVKSCETANHINYFALADYGSGFREIYQIDPLLAFVEAVNFINNIIKTGYFQTEPHEYKTTPNQHQTKGTFKGQAYLIRENCIEDELIDFRINLAATNSNNLATFSVDVEIIGILKDRFYSPCPMAAFQLGCQIIASKLSYFNKY